MSNREKIAKILLDIKAVQVKINPPFTWNTGFLAPIYCDNRLLISYPKERSLIIQGFKDLISESKIEFDVIAGTATAGVPWASFLALEFDKPLVYVRAQPKDYGRTKQIEGTMPTKAKALIVEDLIATGRSSLTSVLACRREYEAEVVGVLAIFDYQMKRAQQSFEELKVPLMSLCDFSTLIQVAAQEQYLTTDEEKQSALSWGQDPDAWHKAHGGKEILTIKK